MTYFLCTCCGAIFDSRDASPERPDPLSPDLLTAIAERTRDCWFTSGELFREAKDEYEAALDRQEATPALWLALQNERITNPHALGQWLGKRVGEGVERAGRAHGSTQWRVRTRTAGNASKAWKALKSTAVFTYYLARCR